VTTIRATLVAIGGIGHPTARFVSKSEDRTFALRLESHATAQQLARFIYGELEIVAEVQRNEEGVILSGNLSEVREVLRGEAMAAWTEWYARAGFSSDEVEDLEAALCHFEEDFR